MAMMTPPHPGAGLKDDLEALGLSTTEAAQAVGVTRQALNKVINGTSGISPEMAIRLEQVIGATADHWLRLQGAYDLSQIRQKKADSLIGLSRFVPAQPQTC